ncbi:DUF2633 family protein [Affinibrenneria salicis]|uniref:DUF2633 family protein n=1 Tax=Affinibrenneria salicis TaxID=2590031 RepID=A0A5J5FYS4_9GAMM|nr:YfgG family protein [Affinibrenneria salicis]KAA8998908.1 DUF2633 family protein [Affinibrenneria salicis]
MNTLTHRRRLSMRSRRSSSSIARTVLLISFLILLGRFAWSAISAYSHHLDKQASSRIEQTMTQLPPSDPFIPQKE